MSKVRTGGANRIWEQSVGGQPTRCPYMVETVLPGAGTPQIPEARSVFENGVGEPSPLL